jgi:hypothetical protein
MIERADRTTLLIDSSKFEVVQFNSMRDRRHRYAVCEAAPPKRLAARGRLSARGRQGMEPQRSTAARRGTVPRAIREGGILSGCEPQGGWQMIAWAQNDGDEEAHLPRVPVQMLASR